MFDSETNILTGKSVSHFPLEPKPALGHCRMLHPFNVGSVLCPHFWRDATDEIGSQLTCLAISGNYHSARDKCPALLYSQPNKENDERTNFEVHKNLSS